MRFRVLRPFGNRKAGDIVELKPIKVGGMVRDGMVAFVDSWSAWAAEARARGNATYRVIKPFDDYGVGDVVELPPEEARGLLLAEKVQLLA